MNKLTRRLAIISILLMISIGGCFCLVFSSKSNTVKAATNELVVEKVVKDENGNFVEDTNELISFLSSNSYPVSDSNVEAINSIETHYLRITNNTNTDMYVTVGVSDVEVVDNQSNEVVENKSVSKVNDQYVLDDNGSLNLKDALAEGVSFHLNNNNQETFAEEETILDDSAENRVSSKLSNLENKTFVLNAGCSIVIPFKTTLNQDAGNLFLNYSLTYDVVVNGRSYTNSDSVMAK